MKEGKNPTKRESDLKGSVGRYGNLQKLLLIHSIHIHVYVHVHVHVQIYMFIF